MAVAQVDIGLRDFGREADLRVGEIGFGGAGLRARRLDRAALAAEQIDLPRRVEAEVEEVEVGRAAGAVIACCCR